MSRSFKHTPICKSCPTSGRGSSVKIQKRLASRKVRRSKCVNGSHYKRLFNPWDIHDYINYWSWPMDVEHHYQSRNSFLYRIRDNYGRVYPLDFLRWAKYYLRK